MASEAHQHPRRRRIVSAVQLLLTATGLLALLYCGWAGMQINAAQQAAGAFGQPSQRASSSQDADEKIMPNGGEGGPAAAGTPAAIIGRVEIPAIDLSVPMTAGIDKESLLRGAGHVPGTAFPGGLGTMGIAGHRDTFFRPLRRVRVGMQVKIIGSNGAYRYRIDSIEIVDPDKVQVLNIASRPMLTLVTCYPFSYIGAAPQRFIVHAHLLSVAPDSD